VKIASSAAEDVLFAVMAVAEATARAAEAARMIEPVPEPEAMT
jgi:hypothetical protein